MFGQTLTATSSMVGVNSAAGTYLTIRALLTTPEHSLRIETVTAFR